MTAAGASFLGIDIGGTKVSLGAVRGAGRADAAEERHALARWRNPAGDVEEDLSVLRAQVADLRRTTGWQFAGVGVAVAATLDADGRVVAWPNRPTWTGLDLLRELRSLFPQARVVCGDDGSLAAVAEARAVDATDVVYVGVGTGVGGGMIAGGRLVPGLSRGSCELGHLIVNRDGARCACGRRGCLQAESSGPATLSRAAATRGKATTFDELRAGYADGAAWAVAAVRHSCAALAAALAGVGELSRPAAHIVGGGFAAGIPGFVAEVARHAATLSRPGHPVAPVRSARFGAESSLRGAIVAATGELRDHAVTTGSDATG
ncbi:ROK family protein [Plantactinospora sp. BB1]|uniref:ROK family protein n=1 Tax=Plantactinospora sp. BB1 TaxID=2071627 RepID=UPI000D15CC45|nr:ROK family protein [Plantactinospora sp. BB1]AVT38610.1 ROK domain protein [Plantactinospora sp. BB1]